MARVRSSRVALGLAAVLAVVLTVRRIDDFDVWYHLAAGRLMATTWQWPLTNTFAYTTPDHPWIDLQWMFQLLLYGAFALAGPNGCIALAVVLVLVTVGLLAAAARRVAPDALVALLVGAAVVIASPRLVPRPELVSFALLAAYLRLLDGYPANGRALWWLVPLQVVWVNSQGIFAVGIVLIACYWAGATLAFLPLPRGWREATGCRPPEWRRLTAVLALATAACLLNPYGVRGALFPFDLLPRVTNGSFFSDRIGEFRPPFASGYAPPLAYAWATLLAATALSFVPSFRRWHLGRLFVAAAVGLLSAQALRNVALFAWVAVPVLAANLGPAFASARTPDGPPVTLHAPGYLRALRTSAVLAVVGVLVLLVASVVTNRFSRYLDVEREFGLGVSSLHFPIAAEQFARDVGIGGRPFNCLATGGYLAWRRYPEERVFIDGRLEAYPESFFQFYFDVLDDPPRWTAVVERYHPDYAILYHVWSNRYPLARYLAGGHGWTLVYHDEVASLYMPIDEAHRAVRERAAHEFAARRARSTDAPAPSGARWSAISVPVADVRRAIAYGDFLAMLGDTTAAIDAYRRALVLDPGASRARFALGVSYWSMQRSDEAMAEWREMLRRDPTFEPARAALGEAERLTGGGP